MYTIVFVSSYYHYASSEFRLLNIVIADASTKPFYELVVLTDFVKDYFNLRELTRPLSDVDHVKVIP